MKRVATIFLRAALIVIGLGVAAICLFLIPAMWGEVANEYFSYAYAIYAVFIAICLAAIPYFVGVYKAWQLLSSIDKGRAFSLESVKIVRIIAACAAVISIIYIASLPFFYIWAQADDAPGLVIIGMMLVGLPTIVSVFAALLQRLISEAADLKSENELTV